MRHRRNRYLQFGTGVQKRSLILRSLLTNLVKHGHIVTTSKKAKVLKAEADSFLAKLVIMHKKYDENGAKRESIRLIKSKIFGEDEGKRVVSEIIPAIIASGKASGFIADYKMGPRSGDAAERVLVKISLD